MEELFDIFSNDYNWIGTATRNEVHRKGYWHHTFHCWVVHPTPEGLTLLLQLRHPSKDTHPNQLDVSCAGHLEAGERPSDGIRELKEELGLEVRFSELHSAGVYRAADRHGDLEDNEFCHIFVCFNNERTLEQYVPQLDEVSGLYLVDLAAFKALILKDCESIRMKGFDLLKNGQRKETERSMSLSDLVKKETTYYDQLFDCLDRLNRDEGGERNEVF